MGSPVTITITRAKLRSKVGNPSATTSITLPQIMRDPRRAQGCRHSVSHVDDTQTLTPDKLQRDRDEAVPIPVEDLVQARGAVHQLKLMVERGGFDEVDLEMLGHVLVGTSAEQPPRTRGEILRYLDGLRDRLTDSLPSW